MAEHNMVSLKRERKEGAETHVEEENYPLRLYLEEEEIKALKLDTLELEDERVLVALVRVTGISANEIEGEEKQRSMTLTLRAGEIISKPTRSLADRMFKGGGNGAE